MDELELLSLSLWRTYYRGWYSTLTDEELWDQIPPKEREAWVQVARTATNLLKEK